MVLFKAKKPVREQRFLKTWVQIWVSGTVGIIEITEKQVFSRISPDVQNSYPQ